MRLSRNYLLLAFFNLFFLIVFAQQEKREIDRYLSFGPTITSYKGDLNSTYSKASGGLNMMIVPERDKLIQTSLELNIGRVVGQNYGYYSQKYPEFEPNTFFQTSFTSFSFNIRAYLYRKNNFKIYLGQGIGAMRFVPKDMHNNKLIENFDTRYNGQNSSPETYNNLTLILPRVFGVSYRLKNDYRLSLDVNQQTPLTDYVDNISKLGTSSKRDKILLVRFSVMIPILFKKEENNATVEE